MLMKLLLFIFALPLLAQTDFVSMRARSHGNLDVGTVKRVTNPPQNVFEIQTKGIAELGAPLCLERVVVRARLLSGERNSAGEERFIEKAYTLTLMEQHNGITEPRSINLGRGKLLSMEVKAFPLMDDFICGTKRD